MKKLVKREETKEITLNNLLGNELVAYRCKSNNNAYAILAKLGHSKYGFIPLNSSNSNPRYMAEGWFVSVKIALDNRDLRVFITMKDLLQSIFNEEF